MKIAFIAGVNFRTYVKQGDIAFTLCDFINENSDYTDFYNNIDDMYKITDNMAAENGISSSIEQVIKAVRAVNSDEVWASDKLYDKDETLKLTQEFIDEFKKHDDLKNVKIVGLPQGKNLDEWLDCYKQMVDNDDINVIALSKYSCPEAFSGLSGTSSIGLSRAYAVKYLHDNGLVKKPLHLAGACNKIIDEIKLVKHYRMVRSIDSNIAFKLGVMGYKIDECEAEPKERLDHHMTYLNKQQIELIEYNIKKVKEALR